MTEAQSHSPEHGRFLVGETSMSKVGATGLQITLPDPEDEHLLHSFSVDPEIVSFLYSIPRSRTCRGKDSRLEGVRAGGLRRPGPGGQARWCR
jgi:hypothetical protein